jgi:hypothetical protein
MNPYTQPPILRPIFESVLSLFLMPFFILGIACGFILILIALLVMWPLAPFFVYVDRKRELTKENEDD